jgi:flagellar biosynthesis protein FlhB
VADQGQQTEKPTKKKLQKARSEGQFPASRELMAALQFLTFVALLDAGGARFLDKAREVARHFLAAAFHTQLTPRNVTNMYRDMLAHLFTPLLWMGACLFTVSLVGQLGSTGFGISPKKLAPDLKRLNPLQKITNVPQQNMASFLQALLFLPLLGWAVYSIANKNFEAYAGLIHQGISSSLRLVAGSLQDLLWKATGVFLLIGALDYFRQYSRHSKSLKMSKQEVRDEAKESEGNPQMKSRIRRIQRDLARRSMMKEVPKATAVIVNPTHYSVAILYEMESMAAPRVVAKGKNYLARRIREIAIQHQVPILENEPLAQALYKSADVGQEIPPHLYRAVAEVLAYIFKIMNPGRN